MKTFLALIGAIVIGVIGVIWDGYALSILWRWFVASTFGIALLSVPGAIGVTTIIRFITIDYAKRKDDKEKSEKQRHVAVIVRAILGPAVALLFGWIVKQWM